MLNKSDLTSSIFLLFCITGINAKSTGLDKLQKHFCCVAGKIGVTSSSNITISGGKQSSTASSQNSSNAIVSLNNSLQQCLEGSGGQSLHGLLCLISELLVLFCTPVYTAQSKSLFISIDRERKSRIKLLLLYNLCIYKNMARTMFVLQRLATSHLYLKNRK